MTITTAQTIDYKTAKHARLVSFENSNSWIKRYDDQGELIVQAGFTDSIGMMSQGNDENPIVITGNTRRWYGSRACLGQHTRIHGRDKVATARDAFAACLRPSDDGRELIVVASHWDYQNLNTLKPALEGRYSVVRNGQKIECIVSKVLPILEGLGSYHAVKPKLEKGFSLLIELGFGTAEQWLIDDSGEVIDGSPVTSLGVCKLVDSIAADPTVRAGLGISNNSTSVNLSLVSAGLQAETIGKLSAEQWRAIKKKHVDSWFQNLQSHLATQFESQNQNIMNLVLSGGGAGLLLSVKPEIIEFFTVPPNPQVASVIGAYDRQMSKVGV